MEEALEHSDIGTKDYVFEESLITSLFFRPGWSRPIAKTKLKKNACLETKNTESSMKEKLQSMIPFEGDLSIYYVIWLDRGINNFQPRSSNFMESAYASEENRNGASFGKKSALELWQLYFVKKDFFDIGEFLT